MICESCAAASNVALQGIKPIVMVLASSQQKQKHCHHNRHSCYNNYLDRASSGNKITSV